MTPKTKTPKAAKVRPKLSVIHDVEGDIWICSVPAGYEVAVRMRNTRGWSFQILEADE